MHVVIAGGTSPTLGRSTVTACLAAGHQVTILSRMPEDPATALTTKFGATVRHVPYDDVDILKSAIAGANVVVSVLKIIDEEVNVKIHLGLLRACLETPTVTRFVPSDWSMYSLSHQHVDMLAHKAKLSKACQESVESSNRDDFEVAQFKNGGFLNYFVQQAPSITSKPYLLGGLDDPMMLRYINIAQGVLKIPVDSYGRPAKVSMTHLDDIGKYVSAAVALPPGTWPQSGIINIAGNTFTYEDVRTILEKDCGVTVKHETVSASDCDKHKAEADKVLAKGFDFEAFIVGMVAQMQRLICSGERNGAWADNDLASRCPQVTPIDLKEYLIDAWGKK